MPDGDAQAVAAQISRVYAMIEEAQAALDAPRGLMGPPTWYGSKADSWRGDWDARRRDIQNFLRSAHDECRRIMQTQGPLA